MSAFSIGPGWGQVRLKPYKLSSYVIPSTISISTKFARLSLYHFQPGRSPNMPIEVISGAKDGRDDFKGRSRPKGMRVDPNFVTRKSKIWNTVFPSSSAIVN